MNESNININFDGGLGENQIPGLTDNEAIFPGSEGPIIDISGGVEAIEESVVVVGDGEGAIADLTGRDGETLAVTRSLSSVGETDSLTGEVIGTSVIQTRSGSSDFIKVEEVFNSGKFVVGETGEVSIDYLFDGGWYKGELAVFSLAGIDDLEIRSYGDFVKEASRRALSNSELGYVVLDDRQDGAYFGKGLGLPTWNKNSYQGPKILEMNPGDEFALMLMPHGRIEEAFNNPSRGGHKRPVFSLSSDNEELGFPVGQIADITGDGKIFGFEDVKADSNKGDRNYSDVVFKIEGAEGEVSQLDEVINQKKDWRSKAIFKKLEESLEYPNIIFDGGKFAVGETGEVKIDYLFDGGWYKGELAIFSLEGLEEKSYEGFVKEAASRALSNSELGYIAIRDPIEGAKFEGRLGERNFNSGDYLGEKTFEMNPGDKFAFMFVPHGSIQGVFNNPKIGGSKHPFFSLVTDNPDDEFRPGQMGDVTGEGVIFAFEDLKVKNNNADRDYNDFVFSVNGVEDAVGVAVNLDEVINPQKDWRELELAQELINSVNGNAPQDLLLLTDLLYNPGETLDILGKVSDADGGSDIAKIDFWLQKDGGEWEDVADVTEFVVDDEEARFAYELAGLDAGKYRLKAIAYDIDGNENEFTEGFTVLSLAAEEELSSRVKSAIERAMNLDSYDPEALAATREWVVSVKAGESAAELASSFGWKNLGSTGHIPNTYIWEFGEDAAPEDVAKQLSLLSEVEFAYPLVPVELQWMSEPADEPLVKDGSQWHLRGGVNAADANVTNAWESGVTGEGVVIGVVDDGFEIDDPEKGLVGHEDLLPNYRADLSYDFGEEDPYPSRLINGVVTSPEPAKSILDGGNAVSQLHSSLSGFVKELKLEFNLNHEDVSNLEVALVSPRGTEKLLTEVVNGANVIELGEVFEKEGGLGNWQLEVRDGAANGKKGILDGWSLELETVNIHGTAAAGVAVAAGDNNLGGSGVAPEAEWAGLRINAGPKPLTGDVLAEALSWKSQEIDIYSNSYGPGFFDVLPGAEYNLEKMTADGRDGKGNIYAFAGGNGADIGGNVNYNSLANARQTIAVAAIDREGKHPFYSEPGAPVLVSAYSDNAKGGDEFVGITTTGPGNSYIDNFTGTSASTPFVAAGIGLMLEANPNLTVRDVQQILVETSNKNDAADGDWVENGGGYWVNHKYGFGAINVEKAVELAKDWTPINKEVEVSRVGWEGTGAIPDYDGSKAEGEQEFLTSTIAIDEADDVSVEWVEVMFNGEHRYLGELEIVLISPDGTESVLTSPHTRNEKYGGDRFNSLAHWTFTSARHWGESSAGEWQLRVADKKEGTRSQDKIPGKRNFWTSWQLNLFGTKPNAAPEATNLNQELTYTEEVAIALNDIVITDPDAGDIISVTLELNNPAGGSIARGEDESDAAGALSFEGSLTDVNNWLTGLEFTPAPDFTDNLEVTVAVTDNNISWPLTGTIKLLGEADNDAPTIAQQLADQTATEDEPFEFVMPAETFADVDDESLDYSATVGGWLTFDGATGTFSGTPTNEDVGTVEVTVTAADAAGAEVSDGFAVTVENVNDAPTVVKEIGDQTATVGETLQFAFPEDTFADADAGDSLSYNVTLEDGSPLPGWLFFNSATRTFQAMPGSEDVGSLSVKVEATDEEDASASDVFVLTVEAATLPIDLRGQSFMVMPGALAAGDSFNVGFMLQNAEAGDAGGFEVGFYLSEDETIAESDRFLGSYSVGALAGNGGTSSFLVQQLPEAGDEFWKGDGSYFVGMILDVGGAIAESNEDNNASLGAGTDYATIEVNNTEPLPINSPPTLTNISTLTGATEGEAFTISYDDLLAASDATDADGDALTFQIEGLLSGELTKDGETVAIGATVLAEGEEIVWTPDVVGDAVEALSVKAFDGEEYSDVGVEVVVAVEAGNTAPTLTNISTLTGAFLEQPFTITYEDLLAATDVTDAEGDPISFRIKNILGSLTEDGKTAIPSETILSEGEKLVWTPYALGSEIMAFTVTAFDGKDDSSNTIVVTVSVTEPIDDRFTDIGAELEGVQFSSGLWGDYDNDGDLDVLLTGTAEDSSSISKVYRNDGGNFTDIGAALKGTSSLSNAAAWGDYDNDNDLDILLTSTHASSYGGSAIYRNDGGNFVEIPTNLPKVGYSSVDWGDYDNDGDLDILLTGDSGPNISKVYRNDSGVFTDIKAGLVGVRSGSAVWGDYDNDGDLDIFLTGNTGSSKVSKIYRNDSGSFIDINADIVAVNGSGAWGDYDNDGDLDILISGFSGQGSKIYQNDSGVFTALDVQLPGTSYLGGDWGDYDNDGDLDILFSDGNVYRNDSGSFTRIGVRLGDILGGANGGSASWGDYDNDGDLDALLTGFGPESAVAKIYRNNIVTAADANTAPIAPTGLTALADGSDITFSWNAATDAETPTPGLTYNLRVGTTPGGSDIVSPMSLNEGDRLIPAVGNANQNTSWTIKDLEPGTYYWSVQAIDSAFAGSQFATEGSFTVEPPIPTNNWNARFLNRTSDNYADRNSYNFNNPDAVLDLGPQQTNGKIALNQNWGLGNPTEGIQNDYFAMEAWTRTNFEAGKLYKITTKSDDGIWFRLKNASTGEWVGDSVVLGDDGADWKDRNLSQPPRTIFFKVPETGEYDFYLDYYERTSDSAIDIQLEAAQTFNDPATSTEWNSKVFWWDRQNGNVPPTNFHETESNRIGSINLGSGTRADGKQGIAVDWGSAAPNDDIRLPDNNFAIRSYTQTYLETGRKYEARVRGDDGFQLFAKHWITGEWSYFTPQNQWQQAYGSHQTVEFTVPRDGWYDFHFHHYEERGNAYFDLSWEPVNFGGNVIATIGANLRSGPSTSYDIVGKASYGSNLTFDKWTQGQYIDYTSDLGTATDIWYRIAGTDNWISAAIVNGGP